MFAPFVIANPRVRSLYVFDFLAIVPSRLTICLPGISFSCHVAGTARCCDLLKCAPNRVFAFYIALQRSISLCSVLSRQVDCCRKGHATRASTVWQIVYSSTGSCCCCCCCRSTDNETTTATAVTTPSAALKGATLAKETPSETIGISISLSPPLLAMCVAPCLSAVVPCAPLQLRLVGTFLNSVTKTMLRQFASSQ